MLQLTIAVVKALTCKLAIWTTIGAACSSLGMCDAFLGRRSPGVVALDAGEAPPVRVCEVPIVTGGPELFPSFWRGGTIAARCEPVGRWTLGRASQTLEPELLRYPEWLTGRLKFVAVVDKLGFRGVGAGGTNGGDRIFVTTPADGPMATPIELSRSMHAEMGNILFQTYWTHADGVAWEACNAPGYAYKAADGVEGMKLGFLNPAAGSGRTPGMVSQYSESCVQSDYEVVFMNYMADPETLDRLANKDEGIKQKLSVLRRFLRRVVPEVVRKKQ